MQEPERPYVLEILKDALSLMDIKPSAKNALLAYNAIINYFKRIDKDGIRKERPGKISQ